jgi:hypothetical protein
MSKAPSRPALELKIDDGFIAPDQSLENVVIERLASGHC